MNKQEAHRESFIKHRPWICHVSLAHDLTSIHRHGLLSTSALLDLFEVTKADRLHHERKPRKQAVPLSHPLHGEAWINDQSPLRSNGLEKCLDGVTSDEWCLELNKRVFFRPLSKRSECVWQTKLTSHRTRSVLVADTRAFLAVYENELYATSINPGYTLRDPVRRGHDTFKPLSELFSQTSFSVTAVSELSVRHKMSRTDLFTEIGREVMKV